MDDRGVSFHLLPREHPAREVGAYDVVAKLREYELRKPSPGPGVQYERAFGKPAYLPYHPCKVKVVVPAYPLVEAPLHALYDTHLLSVSIKELNAQYLHFFCHVF